MHLNQQKAAPSGINTQLHIVTDDRILFNEPNQELSQKYLELFSSQDITPAQIIPPLEELIRKYTDEPILVSLLATAHRRMQNYEQADQIVRDNYRRFPLSIFARCDYATLNIDEKQLTKAAAALSYTFELSHLYPHRSQFHIAEVIDFYTCVINYFCAIKDFERAVFSLSQFQSIAQDAHVVESLSSMVITAILQENLSVESMKRLFKLGKGEAKE